MLNFKGTIILISVLCVLAGTTAKPTRTRWKTQIQNKDGDDRTDDPDSPPNDPSDTTTESSITEGSTTEDSTTEDSTTEGSTTEGSTTEGSTTEGSTTEGSTTEDSTTAGSTTEESTTEGSTTEGSTTEGSTTEGSTTEGSTTEGSTTEGFTTEGSTTEGSTTEGSTTEESTTEDSTTEGSTTEESTTEGSTTEGSTTEGSTTEGSTTEGSTTEGSTTEGSTTEGSTTEGSTTEGSTTEGSTTEGSTTEGSTTEGSTTEGSTTEGSTTEGSTNSPPIPPSDMPSFVIQDDSNKPCILASMKITLNIPYEAKAEDDKIINTTATILVPEKSKVVGLCQGQNGTINNEKYDGPLLILTWNWVNPTSESNSKASIPVKQNHVAIQFKTDDDETSISDIKININRAGPNFPNITNPGTTATFSVKVEGYEADADESYSCSAAEEFKPENGDGSVKLENVKFQVGSGLTDKFGEGSDCEDSGDDTVAIAVGVTVAVLVVVVVGGFIFKRIRDKRKYS